MIHYHGKITLPNRDLHLCGDVILRGVRMAVMMGQISEGYGVPLIPESELTDFDFLRDIFRSEFGVSHHFHIALGAVFGNKTPDHIPPQFRIVDVVKSIQCRNDPGFDPRKPRNFSVRTSVQRISKSS